MAHGVVQCIGIARRCAADPFNVSACALQWQVANDHGSERVPSGGSNF